MNADHLHDIDAIAERCDEVAARMGRLDGPKPPPLPASAADLKRRVEGHDDE